MILNRLLYASFLHKQHFLTVDFFPWPVKKHAVCHIRIDPEFTAHLVLQLIPVQLYKISVFFSSKPQKCRRIHSEMNQVIVKILQPFVQLPRIKLYRIMVRSGNLLLNQPDRVRIAGQQKQDNRQNETRRIKKQMAFYRIHPSLSLHCICPPDLLRPIWQTGQPKFRLP